MIDPQLLQVLILTKNEEPNLDRVLEKLTWVSRIIIVDSYSTDLTLKIAGSYSNVTVLQRNFDTFANQCNFGLTLIHSKWVLSLDADYVLTDLFIEETQKIVQAGENVAYAVKFKFLVFGKPLLRDNTTPRLVLFIKHLGNYFDDGHAHRLSIDGPVGIYKSFIHHDDRKSLSRWFSNQDGYSIKETSKLLMTPIGNLSLSSKIRKTKIFAPFIVFFYCLFIQGLIFNGWRGWHYTLQRTLVEIMFSLRLIEEEKLKQHIGDN